MLSFWTRYVLLKEEQGTLREETLTLIEQKYGTEKRLEIETEIVTYEGTETPTV